MRRLFIRYRRYVLFIFDYIFAERIRGLDFTMRDKHLLIETGGRFHGYSITPKQHLKEIFSKLSIQEGDKLIDVGCGKGLVLCQGSNYCFEKILGIDIDGRLINIAKKNIARLKLQNVEAVVADAREFASYSEYNYYYIFNPFSLEIFKPVLEAIIATIESNPRKITIIYYNPTCAEWLEKQGIFILKHKLYDPLKDYITHIYVNAPER